MTVRYLPLDGERVSRQWWVLLSDIRFRDKVPFTVGEGHRTMARQRQLYSNPPVINGKPVQVAVPNDNAPHIKTGRPHHAIDFGGMLGLGVNAARVIEAATKRGVKMYRVVPGEPWHVEPDPEDLERYYYANRARVLGIGFRHLKRGIAPGLDVKRAQRLLRRAGFWPKNRRLGTRYGRATQHAVRAFKRSVGLPDDTILGKDAIKWLRALSVADAQVARLKKYGVTYADIIVRQARRAGLSLPLALALVEQESNFRNVYGHDAVANPVTKGGPVTEANYKRVYLPARKAGKGMQGVGPCQLTWYELQDEADRSGGCWDPEVNIAVGFDHLVRLIHAYGEKDGIAKYNGSGRAADAYSKSVRARRDKWAKRL